jgi:anti-sigma regulatory factor (Ser/Thr protein kinase)
MLVSSCEFPATITAPAGARSWLDGIFRVRELGQAGFDARLLVSELVANSVRHSGLATTDAITMRLELDATRLRVEVRDSAVGFTVPTQTPASTTSGGRGLMLVAALATRWGAARDTSEATWFEIDLPAPRVLPTGRRRSWPSGDSGGRSRV